MRIYIESVIIILLVTTIVISESFTLFCPAGEEFSICGKNDCEPTCRFPRGPKKCKDKCRPGCICYKTLVRREKDKKCVTLEECQPNKTRIPPRRPKNPPRKPQCPRRRPERPPSRPEDSPRRPEGPPKKPPCPKNPIPI